METLSFPQQCGGGGGHFDAAVPAQLPHGAAVVQRDAALTAQQPQRLDQAGIGVAGQEYAVRRMLLQRAANLFDPHDFLCGSQLNGHPRSPSCQRITKLTGNSRAI